MPHLHSVARYCAAGPTLLAVFLLYIADSGGAQFPRPAGRRGLPQEHEYQKQLRAFLVTLTEKDFEPPRGQKFTAVANLDADELFRLWVLSIDPVRIGNKRSAPSVNLPSSQFVLAHLESPADPSVIRPAVWAEPLVWLANWKYAGNPYLGSRALKLRAFVFAAVDLMMMDEQQEFSQAPLFHRADWLGPRLLLYAYVYDGVRDVLPEGARKAFAAGVKKMLLRVVKDWGPKGEETFFDIQPAVAMGILYGAADFAELKPAMEAYIKRFFTEGEFYHPAGYFPDQGCFDTGFNGLTLYFATWLAARGDFPWVKDAVARAWKLRGYLMLPEPDEKHARLSPTHFTFRTASPVAHDQWDWPFKFVAAAYVTDDALCQMRMPAPEQLEKAAYNAAGGLGFMLEETTRLQQKAEFKSSPWTWNLWPGSMNFPMVNYGHETYPRGFAARLAALRAKDSPLLKIPFERPGTFVEQFDRAFLIAKAGDFGVIVHTGPVSEYPGKNLLEYPNMPYGLGGGSLSAFWTPAAGSAVLGRRGGMSVPGGKPICFDKPEEWRNWPVHAVIGSTAAGKFFTSARIQKPDAAYEVRGDRALVKVAGAVPAAPLCKERSLDGKLSYARTFDVGPDGVRVETTVAGDGVDRIAELYEVIPAFHREGSLQPKTVAAAIELETGGRWVPATPAYTGNVSAIRIARFNGAVVIRLDRGRRVKLSPAETGPGFLTAGVSRNVLIDLLETDDRPTVLTKAQRIQYTLTPARR